MQRPEAEIASGALVLYENGRVPATLRREGVDADITVVTTRALLELAEQEGAIGSAQDVWRQIELRAPTANPLSATTVLRATRGFSRS